MRLQKSSTENVLLFNQKISEKNPDHQIIVDLSRSRLNDVDVLSSNRLSNFDVGLLVAELLERGLGDLELESLTDALRQIAMRRAGKDLKISNFGNLFIFGNNLDIGHSDVMLFFQRARSDDGLGHLHYVRRGRILQFFLNNL